MGIMASVAAGDAWARQREIAVGRIECVTERGGAALHQMRSFCNQCQNENHDRCCLGSPVLTFVHNVV